ncbi:hypothetical protein ES703_112242 [subsurface metagenome]
MKASRCRLTRLVFFYLVLANLCRRSVKGSYAGYAKSEELKANDAMILFMARWSTRDGDRIEERIRVRSKVCYFKYIT